MSVQSGINFTIVENIDYTTNAARLGYFYVIVDDGSGSPPASLITNIYNAIDPIRAASIAFEVHGPTIAMAAVTLKIVVVPAITHDTIAIVVQNAITNYVDSLAYGGSLALTRLIQVAYDASPSVVNVSNVLINGVAADISAGPQTVIRISTVIAS